MNRQQVTNERRVEAVLGANRLIRRAYESSTSSDRKATTCWHKAEVEAAMKHAEQPRKCGPHYV